VESDAGRRVGSQDKPSIVLDRRPGKKRPGTAKCETRTPGLLLLEHEKPSICCTRRRAAATPGKKRPGAVHGKADAGLSQWSQDKRSIVLDRRPGKKRPGAVPTPGTSM
jgi:hypothetical protein